MAYHKTQRGFSLIEMLIVSAVMLLFFGGLFGTVQVALDLISKTRGTLTALTVANDYMEYIRSLSYDNVGTVAGIPAGALPQVSTTTLNGVTFTRRVLVEYVDSPADGTGAADSNGITTDYKQAKVEVTWQQKGQNESLFLVSNITPRSIETNVGGGTIRVNVTDATVTPLPGAQVRLINNTGTSSIDITRTTDATGIALFGGAPANANYEVIVTAPGYSTDRTYSTSTVPVPLRLPFAVQAADVSTQNFQIDRLGSMSLRLLLDQVFDTTTFTLSSTSELATSTGVTVSGGSLLLGTGGAPYPNTGVAILGPITPTPLVRFHELMVTASTGVATDVRVRVYTSSSTSDLVPDTDLPGNSAGFAGGVIDLSTLDGSLYPTIYIGLTLTTTNTNETPRVHEVVVEALSEEDPLVGGSVTLQSSKLIGSNLDTTPVYKHTFSDTTDSTGAVSFADVEWDGYSLAVSGYDVREACAGVPVIVDPDEDLVSTILLAPNSAHTVRVIVETTTGDPIPNATVELDRGAILTETTSDCGQVFFDSLPIGPDYTLTVSAPGYSAYVINPFDVSGDIVQTVTLIP